MLARVVWRAALAATVSAFALLLAGGGALRAGEIGLIAEDFKRLEPAEERDLSRADKEFDDRKYRQAAATYDVFIKRFPKSVAIPYAVMRKGRATQYDNKRHEAIKIYTDVMDYFPDNVPYAAPTLFYIGECHWGNGNKEDALKCWKEIAEDVDYRKHPLAAYAVNSLAGRLVERGEHQEALKYFMQVAVDFREANRDAANHAIGQIIWMHIRVRPDVKKLREACKKLNGLEGHPRSDFADNDAYFWNKVRGEVSRFGGFSTEETAMKKDYFGYWAGVMDGNLPADDDFQKTLADFHLIHDDKGDKWFERLDKQFETYQKPNDYERIIKWILYYRYHQKKMEEYYSKLNFAKLKNEQIVRLLMTLLDPAPAMSKIIYYKLHFDEMSDDDKVSLANGIGQRIEELALDLFHRLKDEDRGRMEELRFWSGYGGEAAKKAKNGLPLADQCASVPDYAAEAYWIKASLLRGINKLEEAIQAYQMSDCPPKNLYAIADCYVALGRVAPAVEQLREIENFFVNEAPAASLRIAHVYRGAGKRDLCVSELRGVLKKYPSSGQSSAAHQELEAMGEQIGGGEDAD